MNTIKRGSRGTDVATLQSKLGLRPDGIFGPGTERAVRAYQKAHGLTPDGIVGPHTWETLGYAVTGRVIDEIIVHCTATREGHQCTSAQVDATHKAAGFSAYTGKDGRQHYIGYHYLIHPDGRIEQCRPEARIGCHTSGHNARSIGVSYVGGLDARDRNGSMIKDTRTPAQKAALIKLIKELKGRYPSVRRIIGHRDTSPDLNGDGIISPYEWIKGCPCFDAAKEYAGL